jgi:long-chain acyl-CoA synthetase
MINITRTFDILSYNEKHQPLKKALSIKRNNRWNSFSTQEYRSKVNLLSFALMELGFKKGDKVATVINNSPEWNFLDFGMSQLGVVHVGIYPTIGAQEYAHILSHSEARILVLSSKELYEKIAPVAKKIDTIKGILQYREK